MLFANRASSKLFRSATGVGLVVVLFLGYLAFNFGPSSIRDFDPFRNTNHDSDSKDGPIAQIPELETVTITNSLLPSPVVAPTLETVTIKETITVTGPTPYSTPVATAIPEKIWYKLGPKGLSDESREWVDSCLQSNPTFRHEFLTDESGDYYVDEFFAARPDIVYTYHQLTVPILKADLLRYLVLYTEGGIYNDLDVSCEDEPDIHKWIPDGLREGANVVVGLEWDRPWEETNEISQFCNWAFMARPGSQHLQMVIDDVIEGLRLISEENRVPISQLNMVNVGDVIELTGPMRLTRSIYKSLGLMLDTPIHPHNISGLREPKLVGDVLILPTNAFAADVNGLKEDQESPKFISHHYASTWKNANGGEQD